MDNLRIEVEGGKYAFVVDGRTGSVSIERNGERWLESVEKGSKALIALLYEHEAALEKVKTLTTDEEHRRAAAEAIYGYTPDFPQASREEGDWFKSGKRHPRWEPSLNLKPETSRWGILERVADAIARASRRP